MKNNILTECMNFTADEKVKFSAWLDEYLLDMKLSEIEESISDEDAGDQLSEAQLDKIGNSIDAFDAELQPGQIRLFSSSLITFPGQLPYFAVISRWDDDLWLIVPFSRFSHPATTGEVATGLEDENLKVLQVWNARTVQAYFAEKSWPAGTLPENLRRAAGELFINLTSGDEIADEFKLPVGAPLMGEAFDPRTQYLLDEKLQYRPLQEQVLQLQNWRSTCATLFKKEEKDTIAAASSGKCKDMTFAIGNTGSELIAGIKPGERYITVDIFNHDGNYDLNFDGFTVANKNGVEIAIISNGKCVLEYTDFDGRIILLDKSKQPVKLGKK